MNFEKNNNLACDIINNLQTRNKETSEVLDNLLHIIKNNIDKFKKGRC